MDDEKAQLLTRLIEAPLNKSDELNGDLPRAVFVTRNGGSLADYFEEMAKMDNNARTCAQLSMVRYNERGTMATLNDTDWIHDKFFDPKIGSVTTVRCELQMFKEKKGITICWAIKRTGDNYTINSHMHIGDRTEEDVAIAIRHISESMKRLVLKGDSDGK